MPPRGYHQVFKYPLCNKTGWFREHLKKRLSKRRGKGNMFEQSVLWRTPEITIRSLLTSWTIWEVTFRSTKKHATLKLKLQRLMWIGMRGFFYYFIYPTTACTHARTHTACARTHTQTHTHISCTVKTQSILYHSFCNSVPCLVDWAESVWSIQGY